MITDIIIAIIFLLLMIKGGTQGLFKTIVQPIAFLITILTAYVCYQITQNFFYTIAVWLIGPFIFGGIIRFLFKSLGIIDKDEKKEPSLLSMVLGGIIAPIWGLFFILPIIFVLGLMPPILNMPWLKNVKTDVERSITFNVIKSPLNKVLGLETKTKNVDGTTTNKPISIEELAEDKRMKALLTDPDVQKAIQDKNYSALLTNPKMMDVIKDPILMKKIIGAYGEIGKQQLQSK